MKLFFSPGACSLSPHIALREAGLPFEMEKVDLRSHQTQTGRDYYSVNPKGYVPALQLDNGEVLTEGPAILQYVADQVPGREIAPPLGSFERYRLAEWLHFIGTELHKAFSPLFRNPSDEVKKAQLERISSRFSYVSEQMGQREYLLGSQFTVADAYLFVMVQWAKRLGPDLSAWPSLQAFGSRMAERPAVKAALEAEAAAKSA